MYLIWLTLTFQYLPIQLYAEKLLENKNELAGEYPLGSLYTIILALYIIFPSKEIVA